MVNFQVQTDTNLQKFINDSDFTEADIKIKNVVILLFIGHIVEIISYFLYEFLASRNLFIYANIMRFLTSLIFYFYPVFYGCYTFNKYTNVIFRFDTTYSNFLYQEVFLFMGVILSGMVLMAGLFIFKYTSLWKEAILRETKDLW